MAPRVLVIEDEPLNLEVVSVLLEDEGRRVLGTTSAEAGLRIARTERPDVIPMDVQLPGMTGYEAARRLRADPATQAIPVIALTAQAMCGEEEKARAAGCDACVTKPVDLPSFRETLRCFLCSNVKRAE